MAHFAVAPNPKFQDTRNKIQTNSKFKIKNSLAVPVPYGNKNYRGFFRSLNFRILSGTGFEF